MATTAAELTLVQAALAVVSTGQTYSGFTLDGMSVTYDLSHKAYLQEREAELLKRLNIRNIRKRTFPDFS